MAISIALHAQIAVDARLHISP